MHGAPHTIDASSVLIQGGSAVLRTFASGTEADDMHDDFKPQFKEQRSGAVDDIIRHDISTNKVLLYMKVRLTAPLHRVRLALSGQQPALHDAEVGYKPYQVSCSHMKTCVLHCRATLRRQCAASATWRARSSAHTVRCCHLAMLLMRSSRCPPQRAVRLCPGFLHPCCIAVAAQYTTETADPVSADTSTADVDFQSRNVLADPELREAIKKFSNWPTIPQVLPHSTTRVVRKLPPESLAAWSRPAVLLAARLGRPPVKCWRSSRCIRSDDALWPLTCSCTSRGSLWAGATS